MKADIIKRRLNLTPVMRSFISTKVIPTSNIQLNLANIPEIDSDGQETERNFDYDG